MDIQENEVKETLDSFGYEVEEENEDSSEEWDDEFYKGLESEEDEDVFKDELSREALSRKDKYADALLMSDTEAVKNLYAQTKEYLKIACKNHKFFTMDEIREIMDKFHNGNEMEQKLAKEKMIMSVTRFVVNIAAKHYATYFARFPMDLVQEGLAGATEALDTYNPSRGKFTTWSSRSIIHNMQDFVNSMTHNTTPHYGTNIRKLKEIVNSKNERGIEWTKEDLAIETGISAVTVDMCFRILNRNQNQTSINNDENYLSETLTSNFPTPEEVIFQKDSAMRIVDALQNALTDSEREVVKYMVGFGDETPHSDKEISKFTGIKVQDIRKIRSVSLYKLKKYMILHHDYNGESGTKKPIRKRTVGLIKFEGIGKEHGFVKLGEISS